MSKLWIARNKDGELYLFNHKPIKDGDWWRKDPEVSRNEAAVFFTVVNYSGGLGFWWSVMLYKSMFPEVTWENSPIELTLNLKTKE